MAGSALRSRARAPQSPANPFVFWGILAACAGLVLVGLAAYFYKTRSEESARAAKWKRGVEILNRLTKDVACDYFYNRKQGRLPDEAWAPFRAYETDGRGDFLDAMLIRKDIAGANMILDAARYKEGKGIDGQQMAWSELTPSVYLGRPGQPPEPQRAQVEIFEGKVRMGTAAQPVFIFRRPILDNDRTSFELGQAVVILFRDPQPGAAPAATPARPESAPSAGKPEVKAEARPEDKGGAAPEPKKDAPAPAAKP